MGITTAYFLRQHGADVTILESQSEPAAGASHGNGGYYQASAPDPWNAPGASKLLANAWWNSISGKGDSSAFVARTPTIFGMARWGLGFLRNSTEETFLRNVSKNRSLAQYSLEVVRELNANESLNYNWTRNGGLVVFYDRDSFEQYSGLARFVAEQGSNVEFLDRDALLAKEPSLSGIRDRLVGAVFFPDDQAGNSKKFCHELASVAAHKGVEFQYGVNVQGVAASGGQIHVRAAAVDIRCDAVVVAAGVHSKRLLKPLGISVPIVPAKGYSLTVPMTGWENPPRHVIADMGLHVGANPMGDVLRLAGVAEFAGMKPGVAARRLEYLKSVFTTMFPLLADSLHSEEVSVWGGHRPLCVDGIPIIGATNVPGIYVNTGHGGLGWTQAPGSSKALADLVAGVEAGFNLNDFAIDRF